LYKCIIQRFCNRVYIYCNLQKLWHFWVDFQQYQKYIYRSNFLRWFSFNSINWSIKNNKYLVFGLRPRVDIRCTYYLPLGQVGSNSVNIPSTETVFGWFLENLGLFSVINSPEKKFVLFYLTWPPRFLAYFCDWFIHFTWTSPTITIVVLLTLTGIRSNGIGTLGIDITSMDTKWTLINIWKRSWCIKINCRWLSTANKTS